MNTVKRPPCSAALGRCVLAEFVGTALLLAAVVGSGIAAQRLSPHDIGLDLLEVAIATSAALAAIILAVGPVGAHLNPVVTLADCLLGGVSAQHGLIHGLVQIGGGIAGAMVANVMFSLPPVELSTQVRWGIDLWLAEVVATFGLLLVIFGCVRSGRSAALPFGVGAYIGGAFWFTSSTSFANPAVTIARMLSNTFTGIAPASGGPFIAAQVVGSVLATMVVKALYPVAPEVAPATVGRHSTETQHPREHDNALK